MNEIPSHILKFESDAYHAQTACNLEAIVKSFARHLEACRVAGGNPPTICRSAASMLFANAILTLCGGSVKFSEYCEAYEICEKSAQVS